MHFEKKKTSCSLVGVDKILRKNCTVLFDNTFLNFDSECVLELLIVANNFSKMVKHIFKSHQGWFNSVLSVPGGGSVFCYRDVQAAASGGGCLGDDQRAVGPHHFLPAHICAHSGRIRDSEKTEPAS